MTEKIIIAAMTPERVIGSGLKIPWHVSEDFKLFKKQTQGHCVIMGRKTWESMKGRPLSNRQNSVISKTLTDLKGADVFLTLQSAVDKLETEFEKIFFIGGRNIYKESIEYVNTLSLSIMKFSVKGDIYFPEWDKREWEGISMDSYKEFDHCIYKRIVADNNSLNTNNNK